jgi:rSAM/selenodomain-associated transferase 1
MADRDCALLIFSKVPEPGSVKTRLIPILGKERAAGFYKSLMEKTLQTCRSAGFSAIELWCYPDADHPYFTTCSRRFNAGLQVQRGGDLGERMWCALSEVLKHHRYAIIIGCDCPDLCTQDLITAAAKLEQGYDIVIGPAGDGGYYLLGSNQAHYDLFRGIDWGTATVYSETQVRIRELKLRSYVLQQHWDIDRPEDLEKYVIGH